MDSMYCSEQINIPPELGIILKQYTKAVIREKPKDVYKFSANFFASLAGQVPPFEDDGNDNAEAEGTLGNNSYGSNVMNYEFRLAYIKKALLSGRWLRALVSFHSALPHSTSASTPSSVVAETAVDSGALNNFLISAADCVIPVVSAESPDTVLGILDSLERNGIELKLLSAEARVNALRLGILFPFYAQRQERFLKIVAQCNDYVCCACSSSDLAPSFPSLSPPRVNSLWRGDVLSLSAGPEAALFGIRPTNKARAIMCAALLRSLRGVHNGVGNSEFSCLAAETARSSPALTNFLPWSEFLMVARNVYPAVSAHPDTHRTDAVFNSILRNLITGESESFEKLEKRKGHLGSLDRALEDYSAPCILRALLPFPVASRSVDAMRRSAAVRAASALGPEVARVLADYVDEVASKLWGRQEGHLGIYSGLRGDDKGAERAPVTVPVALLAALDVLEIILSSPAPRRVIASREGVKEIKNVLPPHEALLELALSALRADVPFTSPVSLGVSKARSESVVASASTVKGGFEWTRPFSLRIRRAFARGMMLTDGGWAQALAAVSPHVVNKCDAPQLMAHALVWGACGQGVNKAKALRKPIAARGWEERKRRARQSKTGGKEVKTRATLSSDFLTDLAQLSTDELVMLCIFGPHPTWCRFSCGVSWTDTDACPGWEKGLSEAAVATLVGRMVLRVCVSTRTGARGGDESQPVHNQGSYENGDGRNNKKEGYMCRDDDFDDPQGVSSAHLALLQQTLHHSSPLQTKVVQNYCGSPLIVPRYFSLDAMRLSLAIFQHAPSIERGFHIMMHASYAGAPAHVFEEIEKELELLDWRALTRSERQQRVVWHTAREAVEAAKYARAWNSWTVTLHFARRATEINNRKNGKLKALLLLEESINGLLVVRRQKRDRFKYFRPYNEAEAVEREKKFAALSGRERRIALLQEAARVSGG